MEDGLNWGAIGAVAAMIAAVSPVLLFLLSSNMREAARRGKVDERIDNLSERVETAHTRITDHKRDDNTMHGRMDAKLDALGDKVDVVADSVAYMRGAMQTPPRKAQD